MDGDRGFVIMACLIQVWDATGNENMVEEPEVSKTKMLTEVENIEIVDSYKNLFNTAKVKFPRGTVIRETVTQYNIDEAASGVSVNVEDSGLVMVTRNTTKKAEVSDFKVGQRIRIRLGYLHDIDGYSAAEIAETAKTSAKGKTVFNDTETRERYKKSMCPDLGNTSSAIMFDGYITKCSIDDPIELECEDLASFLKKINCPAHTRVKNYKLTEILTDDLLGKAGLKLHPQTKGCNMEIKTSIPKDYTVADVLTTWAKKSMLFSFIKADGSGNPCLAIGRSYFSKLGDDSIIKLNEESSTIPEIRFDYHVTNNGLVSMNTDKNFLAVEATSWDTIEGNGKQYHITVRLNPDYDWSKNDGNNKYQVLNETKLSRKAMKAGATVLGRSDQKVDLSSYNIVQYAASKIGISHDELLEEVIKYFESYNANGIDGSLTIMGDLGLKSGIKVHLQDNRFPAKNGYYLIEEITTKFGVSDGYKQTIKLPYCISRDKDTSSTT